MSNVTWEPDHTVAMNARMMLPALAGEYFAAGRKIVSEKPEPAELHPFRLATKRFRYTLEIFREVYGPAMDQMLQDLKPVQDALGAVNDCVATKDVFEPEKKFRDYLDRRAAKKAGRFYQSWIAVFDAPGQEERWIQFLARIPKPQSGKVQAAIDRDNLSGEKVGTRK